ncbi:hypothetical protein SD28_04925 [Allofrancisella guangzhouensis]|uniref:DUF1634 domain-containing protein n=1 Tax=Allofrancisella guangzhouensis TaxID=594679 RepID=A0A0A8E4U1_9GAMM|nr:DUF1634 domain-containing protein [Allofrancisella guangzhouensis]AJC49023.1 hypothetical protein SD28_04925 [Allofrancisella guangzhouensis]MBK2027547.1 DUF1634 domain-containing protein [Allofrancisella guangzhouensis]MBK2046085.1 DUF1634 domain-containing protein [Allofrancisella guangzhouensis]
MTKNQIIHKFLKSNLYISIVTLVIGFFYRTYEVITCSAQHITNCQEMLAIKIINFGLFLIIVFPVFRIFLEFCFFIKEKNYTYIIICLLLFVVIGISIIS